MNKIVAIHQPAYFPWLGLFYKIYCSDIFIHYDVDTMSKGSLANKNLIKTPIGSLYLTVPINFKIHTTHKNLTIENKIKWKNKHFSTIRHNYSKSKFYSQFIDVFENIFNQQWKYLDDLNIYIIENFCKMLKIECIFIRASSLKLDLKTLSASEKLVNLVKYVEGTEYLSGYGGKNYNNSIGFF